MPAVSSMFENTTVMPPTKSSPRTAPPELPLVLEAPRHLRLSPLVLLPGEYFLGADQDCDLTLPVAGISARHAALRVEGIKASARSLDSHTWLNDDPLKERALRPGDRLALGPITFRVRRATEEELLGAAGGQVTEIVGKSDIGRSHPASPVTSSTVPTSSPRAEVVTNRAPAAPAVIPPLPNADRLSAPGGIQQSSPPVRPVSTGTTESSTASVPIGRDQLSGTPSATPLYPPFTDGEVPPLAAGSSRDLGRPIQSTPRTIAGAASSNLQKPAFAADASIFVPDLPILSRAGTGRSAPPPPRVLPPPTAHVAPTAPLAQPAPFVAPVPTRPTAQRIASTKSATVPAATEPLPPDPREQRLNDREQELNALRARLEAEQARVAQAAIELEQRQLAADEQLRLAQAEAATVAAARDQFVADSAQWQHQQAELQAKQAELAASEQALAEREQSIAHQATQIAASAEDLRQRQLAAEAYAAEVARHVSELRSEQEALHQQLASSQAAQSRLIELETRESELQRLQAELNSRSNELDSRASELDQQLAELAAQRTTLSEQQAAAQRALDDHHQAQSQLSERETLLSQRLAAHDEHGRTLESRSADLEAAFADLAAQQTELQQQRDELDAVRESHRQAETSLAERETQLHSRSQALDAAQVDFANRERAWQTEVDRRQAEVARLEADLTEREAQLAQSRAALEVSLRENEEMVRDRQKALAVEREQLRKNEAELLDRQLSWRSEQEQESAALAQRESQLRSAEQQLRMAREAWTAETDNREAALQRRSAELDSREAEIAEQARLAAEAALLPARVTPEPSAEPTRVTDLALPIAALSAAASSLASEETAAATDDLDAALPELDRTSSSPEGTAFDDITDFVSSDSVHDATADSPAALEAETITDDSVVEELLNSAHDEQPVAESQANSMLATEDVPQPHEESVAAASLPAPLDADEVLAGIDSPTSDSALVDSLVNDGGLNLPVLDQLQKDNARTDAIGSLSSEPLEKSAAEATQADEHELLGSIFENVFKQPQDTTSADQLPAIEASEESLADSASTPPAIEGGLSTLSPLPLRPGSILAAFGLDEGMLSETIPTDGEAFDETKDSDSLGHLDQTDHREQVEPDGQSADFGLEHDDVASAATTATAAQPAELEPSASDAGGDSLSAWLTPGSAAVSELAASDTSTDADEFIPNAGEHSIFDSLENLNAAAKPPTPSPDTNDTPNVDLRAELARMFDLPASFGRGPATNEDLATTDAVEPLEDQTEPLDQAEAADESLLKPAQESPEISLGGFLNQFSELASSIDPTRLRSGEVPATDAADDAPDGNSAAAEEAVADTPAAEDWRVRLANLAHQAARAEASTIPESANAEASLSSTEPEPPVEAVEELVAASPEPPPPEPVAEPEEDEDSVSAYMARLLARARGITGKAEPAKPTTSKVVAVASALPQSAMHAAEASEPIDTTPRHKQDKDQVRQSLQSFRAVANQTARKAVARHTWKSLRSTIMTKGLIAGACVVTATGLIAASSMQTGLNMYLQGAACSVAGILLGVQFLRLLKETREGDSASEAVPHAHPTAHDQLPD